MQIVNMSIPMNVMMTDEAGKTVPADPVLFSGVLEGALGRTSEKMQAGLTLLWKLKGSEKKSDPDSITAPEQKQKDETAKTMVHPEVLVSLMGNALAFGKAVSGWMIPQIPGVEGQFFVEQIQQMGATGCIDRMTRLDSQTNQGTDALVMPEQAFLQEPSVGPQPERRMLLDRMPAEGQPTEPARTGAPEVHWRPVESVEPRMDMMQQTRLEQEPEKSGVAVQRPAAVKGTQNNREQDTSVQPIRFEQRGLEREPPRPIESSPGQVDRIVENLVDRIQHIRSGGADVLKMRLYPEELGKLEIQVEMREGILSGRILVESEEARQWVAREVGALSAQLEARGIGFEQLEVASRMSGQNPTGQSGQSGHSGQGGFREHRLLNRTPFGHPDAESARRPVDNDRTGRLNILA